MPKMQLQPSKETWIALGAVFLAIPWMIPNHQLPWVAFHTDAAASLVWAAITFVILVKLQPHIRLCTVLVVTVSAQAVITAQYFLGIIYFSGSALLSSLYVVGFYLVYVCAQSVEEAFPGCLLDLVFLAVASASFASVGLQLTQWLDLVPDGLTDIWIMNQSGDRPSGNLGQANQLASLHVWGLIALLWGHQREKVRIVMLLIAVFWVGIGLAIAQSRSSIIALALLAVALICFRRFWKNFDAFKIVFMSLGLMSTAFYFAPHLGDALLLPRQNNMFLRTDGEVRLDAWRMFLDASLQAPWFGFGWNEVLPAQFAVALEHPKVSGRSFAHTHNVFLDLVIWTGWPVGLFLSGCIVSWIVKATLRVQNLAQLLALLPVGTIGVHAITELPLHYAYFLLPTGCFMGAVAASWPIKSKLATQVPKVKAKNILIAVYMYTSTVLGIVVFDYFKVEEQFYLLRFEGARVGSLNLGKTPEVTVLNQFSALIEFARFQAKANMTPAEIYAAEQLALVYPSLSNLFKMAQINALNSNREISALWLRKACAMVDKNGCSQAKSSWEKFQQERPDANVPGWPRTIPNE